MSVLTGPCAPCNGDDTSPGSITRWTVSVKNSSPHGSSPFDFVLLACIRFTSEEKKNEPRLMRFEYARKGYIPGRPVRPIRSVSPDTHWFRGEIDKSDPTIQPLLHVGPFTYAVRIFLRASCVLYPTGLFR